MLLYLQSPQEKLERYRKEASKQRLFEQRFGWRLLLAKLLRKLAEQLEAPPKEGRQPKVS